VIKTSSNKQLIHNLFFRRAWKADKEDDISKDLAVKIISVAQNTFKNQNRKRDIERDIRILERIKTSRIKIATKQNIEVEPVAEEVVVEETTTPTTAE
jgi:hypothetical protein